MHHLSVVESWHGHTVSVMGNTPAEAERIRRAKAKTKRVVDHFRNLLALHENNEIIVRSPILASQIPRSYAANAFNIFRHAMHDFEVVRLCALWDCAAAERESIPSIVELIDDNAIIAVLADEMRSYWANRSSVNFNPIPDPDLRAIDEEAMRAENARYGDAQASNAAHALREAISDAKNIAGSPRLAALRNYRDRHLAHSLTSTHREKSGPVPLPKYSYVPELIDATIPIVEKLHLGVNGAGFQLEEVRRREREYAEVLWRGCKFTVNQ